MRANRWKLSQTFERPTLSVDRNNKNRDLPFVCLCFSCHFFPVPVFIVRFKSVQHIENKILEAQSSPRLFGEVATEAAGKPGRSERRVAALGLSLGNPGSGRSQLAAQLPQGARDPRPGSSGLCSRFQRDSVGNQPGGRHSARGGRGPSEAASVTRGADSSP